MIRWQDALVRFGAVDGGREHMTKTLLNPDELERLILTELRSFNPCENVQDVLVTEVRDGGEANWTIDSCVADGASHVSFDCKRHALAVQVRLQRDFDAIWPDKSESQRTS